MISLGHLLGYHFVSATPVYVWIIIGVIGGVLLIVILAVLLGFRKCKDGKWVRRTSGAMELRHMHRSQRQSNRQVSVTLNDSLDSRTSHHLSLETDQARLIHLPNRQGDSMPLHPPANVMSSLNRGTTQPTAVSSIPSLTNQNNDQSQVLARDMASDSPISSQRVGNRRVSAPPKNPAPNRFSAVGVEPDLSGSKTLPRIYREECHPMKVPSATEGRKSRLRQTNSEYRPTNLQSSDLPVFEANKCLPPTNQGNFLNDTNIHAYDEKLYDEPDINLKPLDLPRTHSYSYDEPENQPHLETEHLPGTSSCSYDEPENIRFPISETPLSPFANNVQIPIPLPKTPEVGSVSKPLPKIPDQYQIESTKQDQQIDQKSRSSSYENVDEKWDEESVEMPTRTNTRTSSYENVDDIGVESIPQEENYQNINTLDVPFAAGNKGYDSDYDSENSFDESGDDVDQLDPDHPPVVVRTKKPRSQSCYDKQPPPVPKQKPKSRRATSCYENW